MPFVSFSYLIVLVRISWIMLNKNGESEHCYLVPDLKGKNPSLSLLNMMLAFVCVCVWMPFIRLETFPPMLVCWVYFYCERVFDFYQIVFLHLLKWSYIFIFYSINTMYYINWFLAVKLTLNSCDKYHLVRLYNYFLLDSVFWYWGTFFFVCTYL